MPQARAQLAKALCDPDSFATTQLVILLDHFGTEFLNWEPSTILQQVEEDFSIEWPLENFDKLMAAVVILTTDRFFKSLPAFIQLANALAGSSEPLAGMDLADSHECAWAITEVLLWESPLEDPEPFADEIRRYLGAILREEGYTHAPDVLAIAVDDALLPQDTETAGGPDPSFTLAVNEAQRQKGDDLVEMIKENLRDLRDQLRRLPLAHGKVDNILEALK